METQGCVCDSLGLGRVRPCKCGLKPVSVVLQNFLCEIACGEEHSCTALAGCLPAADFSAAREIEYVRTARVVVS